MCWNEGFGVRLDHVRADYTRGSVVSLYNLSFLPENGSSVLAVCEKQRSWSHGQVMPMPWVIG